MKLNMADIEVRDFEPIPAGWYIFAITDGEMREAGENAKNPGSEYINWTLTVDSGPYENRKVWTNTQLLDQTLWRLKSMMVAVGLDSDGEIDFEIDDMIGRKLAGRVVIRNSNNPDYGPSNEIKAFKKVDDPAVLRAIERQSGSGDIGGNNPMSLLT